jgi:hypothetical protein
MPGDEVKHTNSLASSGEMSAITLLNVGRETKMYIPRPKEAGGRMRLRVLLTVVPAALLLAGMSFADVGAYPIARDGNGGVKGVVTFEGNGVKGV